jgi:hypothetical protein
MRRVTSIAAAAAVMLLLALQGSASAQPLSGAIFTTLPDGTEVNANIYQDKNLVYLDGGPGVGAPAGAAGLPDGTYVFQVTDPSGKTLLSTDAANCRQFTVSGGIITGVVATGCQHLTGLDVDHGATTVQLMPYLDTPNNGGEYKVWVTPLADYLAGCRALGNSGTDAQILAIVDCGSVGGNRHGFVPSDSKTDNFKVRTGTVVEIDTQFYDRATGALLDGRRVVWTDPLGATNTKWAYNAPSLNVHHEAHVESVEEGTHQITVPDQAGCKVDQITVTGSRTTYYGPSTIPVTIRSSKKDFTAWVIVLCG